jgi:hypothetical protein
VESGIEDSLSNDTDVMTMVNADAARNEERLSLMRQGVDPLKADEILAQREQKPVI